MADELPPNVRDALAWALQGAMVGRADHLTENARDLADSIAPVVIAYGDLRVKQAERPKGNHGQRC